jgi:hypothetical protein
MSTDLQRALPQDRTPHGTWAGRVATDAVDINDPVEVVIPAFSDTLRWGPCRWQARGDNILPERDDECLIQFDNYRQPWMSVWWPNRAVAPIPPDDIAPGTNGQWMRTLGGAAVWDTMTSSDLPSDVILEADVPGGDLGGTYLSPTIAAGAVTNTKLGALAVDNAKLAASAVDNSKVAAAAAIVRSKLDFGSGLVNADVAVAAALEGSKLNWHVGTTPPGSPTDNMLWIYQGSGFYVLYVYDSSEATYKWKAVGAPFFGAVATVGFGTSGTTDFTDMHVTVDRAGVYNCRYWTDASAIPNINTKFIWELFVGNTTAGGSNVYGLFSRAGEAAFGATTHAHVLGGGPWPITVTPAGLVLTLYGHAVNWDYSSEHRGLMIQPVKVI